MPKNQEYESFDSSGGNPVSSIIKKYQNHASIKLIKTKNKFKTFRFRETNTDEIKKLHPKKASQKSDISTNILKKNAAFTPSTSAMISTLSSVPRSSTMN